MARNPHYLSQLAHIEILTLDLEKSVKFFLDIVGLDETGREGNSVYLRAWGDYFHHTLKLTQNQPVCRNGKGQKIGLNRRGS